MLGGSFLKNEIEIRSFRDSDVEELNIIRRSDGIFETILSLKDETVEQTYLYFVGERIHSFVAVTSEDNNVVGYIKLVIDEERRRRHKGSISIAIKKEYQGNGVGKRLFKEMIDLSRNWLMLKKLELTVLQSNTSAIELYKKYGFEVEGISRMNTIVNGNYEDVIFMGKIL